MAIHDGLPMGCASRKRWGDLCLEDRSKQPASDYGWDPGLRSGQRAVLLARRSGQQRARLYGVSDARDRGATHSEPLPDASGLYEVLWEGAGLLQRAWAPLRRARSAPPARAYAPRLSLGGEVGLQPGTTGRNTVAIRSSAFPKMRRRQRE